MHTLRGFVRFQNIVIYTLIYLAFTHNKFLVLGHLFRFLFILQENNINLQLAGIKLKMVVIM